MTETSSIKYIIKLLMSRIKLIILFTILGAAIGYGIAKYVLPLEYASHISMYVQSYTDIREDYYDEYNINNISNSKQLVNTYIEVLTDDTVMDEVGKKLMEEFDVQTLSQNFYFNSKGEISSASIRSCLHITSKTDTSVIMVRAVARDPEVAAFICNALAEVAPEYMMEAVGVGSINTIGKAKTYYSPVSPNVMSNTISSGLIGFVLIVIIIFLFEFFDNTIKDIDTLKNRYKRAIIGEIQQLGEYNKKNVQTDEFGHFMLTDQNIPFDIVESFKSIRTNVTFSLSTNKRKIFSVSSANRGEGKSVVTSNIAIAMAQSGSKVLLIDADMRKSVQHIIFGIKNEKGLSTAASKIYPLDECIQKDVLENLDIITAGPTPPNPSELLASEQMGEILNELSSRYSVIIIDTPPVNVVTDAMVLARYDSAIIIVVRYGITTEDDLKTADQKIEFADANMLGFILNGTRHKQQGGYYAKSKHKRKMFYKKGDEYRNDYGSYEFRNRPETELTENTEPEEQPDSNANPKEKQKKKQKNKK